MKFAVVGFLCMLILLSAPSAQASLFDPVSHFTLNLNDCIVEGNTCVFPTDPNGFGSWESGQSFTDLINTGESTDGFSQNTFDCPECGDPSMIINKGGKSTPFPSSFSANENGGGFLDFFNGTGVTIRDILIQTSFDSSKSYSCASDIFAFCGFAVDGSELDILYTQGAIDPVPEPASVILVGTGLGAILWSRRKRARRF